MNDKTDCCSTVDDAHCFLLFNCDYSAHFKTSLRVWLSFMLFAELDKTQELSQTHFRAFPSDCPFCKRNLHRFYCLVSIGRSLAREHDQSYQNYRRRRSRNVVTFRSPSLSWPLKKVRYQTGWRPPVGASHLRTQISFRRRFSPQPPMFAYLNLPCLPWLAC